MNDFNTIKILWILSLIINRIIIIIDVYRCMLIATKRHFDCHQWDFRWLLFDDKLNTYIDVNQFNRKPIVGDLADVSMMSH